MILNEIIKTMPLATPIENALVDHSGLLGELLDLTTKYITGNGENINQIIDMYSIDATSIQHEFIAACKWCKELGI